MGQRGVYVPIDKRVLEDLYWNRGLSIPEVAGQLGVTSMTVHRRMIGHGIPPRNMGPPPAHGKELKRLVEVLTPRFLTDEYERKQMTTEQIAQQTGFNRGTVIYYLRQAGIPVREGGFTNQYIINKRDLAKLRKTMSPRQIAEHCGCSVTTLERALRRYGLVG